jgi:gamma-glutamylputrescine synthase
MNMSVDHPTKTMSHPAYPEPSSNAQPSPQPCCESEYIAFEQEVQQYLEQFPQTTHVDLCLHDLNGHLRGKRIDLQSLKNLSKGCYFPLSVYAMSLEGKVIEESGLGKYIGEPDRLCRPISGSLRPCADAPETHAQLYLIMLNEDGAACEYDPRNILQKLLQQLHQQNVYPVMAGELEFYLFAEHSETDSDLNSCQCFDIDIPTHDSQVLAHIEREARRQQIEMTAIVAESSPRQYEINIQHSADLLKLCDDMMAIKRIVRQVAAQHRLKACFMAKPVMQMAGSGLHFHMSLLNAQGQNLFSGSTPEHIQPVFAQVIAGLLDFMPASMALLAPNINSFRRFQYGHHVPLEASWGFNNRNVAIRIPCADQTNQRLEYRVAGADANPYLSIAVLLAGTLHGLEHSPALPDSHAHQQLNSSHIFLPEQQPEALKLLADHSLLKGYLGTAFVSLWLTCKKAEYQSVQNKITASEMAWGI